MLIEMKHINKKYKNTMVLSDLNIQIERGSIAGIVGPNSVGKTTLLNVMSGLVNPDSGDVFFEGRPVYDYKSLIGYVPQEIALYQDLSVKDNFKFFSGIYGLSKDKARERMSYIYDIMALKNLHRIKIKNLSGGMKRRINIGVELLKDPRVLIMDESTVGIDMGARTDILDLVRKLNGEGMTVIFTSHHMSELESICSDFYFLKEGSVVLEGKKQAILEEDGKKRTLEHLYSDIYR
ncbi:MAG: ABC transporter ATP-binding protein [Eubacteriales bacterium]|nr:ABC transporter ATP-binding protein [Eubacteriales bacterium]